LLFQRVEDNVFHLYPWRGAIACASQNVIRSKANSMIEH
jgi:hypothetical protein